MDHNLTHPFSEGDIVKHPVYKIGRIIKIEDEMCKVKFPDIKGGNLKFKTVSIPLSTLTSLDEEREGVTKARIPVETPETAFDDLPFYEVKKLYVAKLTADKNKDTRQLTQLLNDYPALFDKTTFNFLEKTFNLEVSKAKSILSENKIINLDEFREK